MGAVTTKVSASARIGAFSPFVLAAGIAASGCTGEDPNAPPVVAAQPDAGPEATPNATIFVRGRVIDADRKALVNVDVTLGERTVQTDGDGRFQFEDVSVPYDLYVRTETAGTQMVGYMGLTRPDPVVRALGFGNPRTITLQGSVTGLEGTRHVAGVVGGEQVPFSQVSVDVGAGTFTVDAAASGARESARVHVLEVVKTGEFPTQITGYGRSGAFDVVANGGTVSLLPIAMAPPPSATVNVAISTMPGEQIVVREVELWFDGSNARLGFYDGVLGPSSITFAAPTFAGASATAGVVTERPNGAGGTWVKHGIRSGGSLSIKTTEITTRLEEPAADARIGPGSRISWTKTEGAVHSLFIQNASGQMLLHVGGTSVAMPDLRALGIRVPNAGKITVQAQARAPMADVDALATVTGLDEPDVNTVSERRSYVFE